ncbi:helix-turn-helix transcriptional regulator [Enterococcus malodoratus]|uniref:helix-turn-helix transcriptional regulator n=1 Tax=Enterococcus malodoratus TaxID=71451 RepID=UPI003FD30629
MDKSVLINDSIDYILSHLEEPITIADVADHLSYSKYYFCRMFKDVTGESVYSFIKRVKLEQSAIDLKIKREKQISQIGLDYGYSASNYSSVFKEMYDQSPIKFRKSVQPIQSKIHSIHRSKSIYPRTKNIKKRFKYARSITYLLFTNDRLAITSS